ncbi:MAG: response regulator [Herminiimonas sp.]|nr:response regulator [Herminiimonas sp.]
MSGSPPSVRILLVEDNATDALIACDELTHAAGVRFDIHRVVRLEEAVAYLQTLSVDLVLLDLSLPDSEGLASFHRLRTVVPMLPVVVFTHRSDEELALSAVYAGAQDYLIKGQGHGQLTRSVRHAIERSRSEIALRRSAAALAAAQKLANIGSWSWDIDAGTVEWSEHLYTIFGLTDNSQSMPPPGRFDALIHPGDHAAVVGWRRRLIATGAIEPIEFRIVRSDGSERILRSEVGELLRHADGRIHSISGIVCDVTQNRASERQLQDSHDRLRALSARLQTVREEQNLRIAREIHDVMAQELTLLKIDLVWVSRNITAPVDETLRRKVARRIDDATVQVDCAITSVQKIATELRPVVLDSLGLFAAVEWQVEEFGARTGIVARAQVPVDETPPDRDRAIAVFRILQESLTNVVRHAQCSKVDVDLKMDEGSLIMTVADDGVGISPDQSASAHSFGLAGMGERALAFGGTVSLDGAPGLGTTVTLSMPLEVSR